MGKHMEMRLASLVGCDLSAPAASIGITAKESFKELEGEKMMWFCRYCCEMLPSMKGSLDKHKKKII